MSVVSFQYAAVDASGAVVRGTIEARDRREAFRAIGAQGLTPTKISQRARRLSLFQSAGRVARGDVARFVHQLSVLLAARLPVTECLTSIAEQEPNARLRGIALDIASRVESGETLTDAFTHHERTFGRIIVETIRAAERSGNLIAVLEQLGEMIEDESEMTRAVRGAMIYPACVMFAISVAVIFLMTAVVPKFATMFAERGIDLPAITVGLIETGDFIRTYWWVLLGTLAAGVFGLRQAWSNPKGKLAIDAMLHRVPRLNTVLVGLAVARFSGVFGVCLRSGLPLMESIELGGRASGRPSLEADAKTLINAIKQGSRLGSALPRCSYFPPFVRQLLRAGETSGELPKMCSLIARTHTRETRHLAQTLAKVIEPVTVMGLTIVVLIVALGVFLPMWDMAAVVS